MTKILILDDELRVIQQIKEFLAPFNYQLGFITQSRFLFPRLQDEPFDLILMDVHMPEKDGVSLLKQLKEHKVFRQIPVIMLTAEVNEDLLAKCFEHGASDFINKPIGERVLRARVENLLMVKKVQGELEMRVEERTAELERLNKTFRLFVPQHFLQRILSEQFPHAGTFEEEHLTIFFADIRSYTTLSENKSSQEVLEILNTYFSLVEPCIAKNGGFIEKFMGDGFIALFDGKSSADKALNTAIEMQKEIQEYNKKHKDVPNFKVGIGINTGPVMTGALGSENRLNSTVIGDHVNLASRLEELTKRFNVPILFSHYTYKHLTKDRFRVRELDTLKVHGRSNPVLIYEVLNCEIFPEQQKKPEIQESWFRGIVYYKSRMFEEALREFKECFLMNPKDKMIFTYVKRCRYFHKHPPDEQFWEGIVEESDPLVDHKLRRRSPRYELNIPVRANYFSPPFAKESQYQEKTFIRGIIEDISLTGIKMISGISFKPGEVFMMDSFFPNTPLEVFFKDDPCHFLCKVIWCIPKTKGESKPSEWKLGLESIVLNVEQEETLEKILPTLP